MHEAHTPQQINTNGGAAVEGDVNTGGGAFHGRDQIVTNIQTFVARALSAAEEAQQRQDFAAERLANSVRSYGVELQERVRDTDAVAGGPYKGLLDFRFRDTALFFGWEAATRQLMAHTTRGGITVLHAESGAGKSSLLQAGLMPVLLRDGQLPVYVRRYASDPVADIKRAIFPEVDHTELCSAPLPLFLRRVQAVLPDQTFVYLLLDQFEDVFSETPQDALSRLADALADVLADQSLCVRWVLALRTEYFGKLATLDPPLSPFQNTMLLQRLSRDDAQQAIEGPARRCSLQFEAGLVTRIWMILAPAASTRHSCS